jgi:hypothetical protein
MPRLPTGSGKAGDVTENPGRTQVLAKTSAPVVSQRWCGCKAALVWAVAVGWIREQIENIKKKVNNPV